MSYKPAGLHGPSLGGAHGSAGETQVADATRLRGTGPAITDPALQTEEYWLYQAPRTRLPDAGYRKEPQTTRFRLDEWEHTLRDEESRRHRHAEALGREPLPTPWRHPFMHLEATAHG